MGVFMWIAAALCGAISIAIVAVNAALSFARSRFGRGPSPVPLLSGVFAGPAAIGLAEAPLRRLVATTFVIVIASIAIDLVAQFAAYRLGKRRFARAN